MIASADKRAPYIAKARALILTLLFLSGCALSTSDRADEAYKRGEYDRAIELYNEAISDGSRDPEVFYRAAQASLKVGDLAGAERYYSRAIRYGGGVPVMRALAQLYIQTSNYTRAAQVLYELLNYDPEQQPIYNNLGTSLMYAGSPFAAESYLLVAQQMDPRDPVPYVNLGLLYDRHMNQVDLGAEFYQCYLSLSSPKAEQRQQILMRLKELGQPSSAQGTERLVVCGEVYAPKRRAGPSPGELRKALGIEEDEVAANEKEIALGGQADPESKGEVIVQSSGGTAPDRSKDNPTVVISNEAPRDKEQETRDRARESYAKGDYAAAARALETIPTDRMSAEDARLMARTQKALDQPLDAETWWRLSLQREPDAVALGELLKLMRAQKRTDDAAALCQMYKAHPELKAVVHYCPTK